MMTTSTALRPIRRRFPRVDLRVVLILAALLIIGAPLALLFLDALKSQTALYQDPFGLPHPVDLNNFVRAWQVGGIPAKALNSVVVTAVSVLLSTTTGAGAGYVCARMRNRDLGGLLTALFALGIFIPVQSALVPLFAEMQTLGLLGTLVPIVLVDAAAQLPLAVVVFASFFAALPIEVEEAARVDGASRLRILRSVVIPLARPAVATSTILGAVAVWNDYFVALVFSTDPSIQTLPIGLTNFKSDFSTDWGGSLAYSALIAAPIFLLYIALQRYITDGVTAGAIR